MLNKCLCGLFLVFLVSFSSNSLIGGTGDSSIITIANVIPDKVMDNIFEANFFVDVKIFVDKKEDVALRKEHLKVEIVGDYVLFSFFLPNQLLASGKNIKTQFLYRPEFDFIYNREKSSPEYNNYMDSILALPTPPFYKPFELKKERLNVAKMTVKTTPEAEQIHLFHLFDWMVFCENTTDTIGKLENTKMNKIGTSSSETFVKVYPTYNNQFHPYVIVCTKNGKITIIPWLPVPKIGNEVFVELKD